MARQSPADRLNEKTRRSALQLGQVVRFLTSDIVPSSGSISRDLGLERLRDRGNTPPRFVDPPIRDVGLHVLIELECSLCIHRSHCPLNTQRCRPGC